MEKKYFYGLLTIMMVAMLGVGLASCDKVDGFSTPVSGDKYTIKVAIKNAGRKMLMEGSADNGATFSYTLEK